MSEAKLKLVTLDPKASAKAEVVKAVKKLLEKAERGELIDLAYFGATPDGGVITGITPTEDQHRRISGCSRLLWRFHQIMDETTEDS